MIDDARALQALRDDLAAIARAGVGAEWVDDAVELAQKGARKRGRPLTPDAQRWKASLQLHGGGHGGPGRSSINREVLDARQAEIAEQRRGVLDKHRGDRRDEAQQARRALVEGMAALHPVMSASSLAAWIKRSCADLAGHPATVRTLRADIAAIRSNSWQRQSHA